MYEAEHTAEHVFMGSLQRVVKNILVRKVEHAEDVNKVYIECSDLTLDQIYEAEVLANKIIKEGREVKEHIFNSLEEARLSFPNMRAYEERISGSVRVVEISGHDYAACAKEHVKNTRECIFFVIKHVSREKNRYELEFLTGEKAEMLALEASMRCIRIANELGSSMNTLESTIKNMKSDIERYKRRLASASEKLLEVVKPEVMNNIKLYHSTFEMLDDRILTKKAGEIIKDRGAVVLFINLLERANIMLACNEAMELDCSSILRSTLMEFGGKGGGKKNFAMGSLPIENAGRAYELLLSKIKV